MIHFQDFHIEQVITGRLSEFAYYVESDKEAIVIDPVRESEPYLELSAKRGATIKYILETHYHSDFVSGHLDLSRKTGAQIVFGPQSQPSSHFYEADDEEELAFGKVRIKVIHTPGHTIESSCYLLLDSNNKPCYLFSGDTLYVGELGRVDNAANFSNYSEEELAGYLYDSLVNKIMPLSDEIFICPAHGDTSRMRYDALGNQKKTLNDLLRTGKETFVDKILSSTETLPRFFFNCARKNKFGYPTLEEVLGKSLKPFSLGDFKKHRLEGCIILDTRDPQNVQKGFIPGSITISLKTNYEAWVGTLIDFRSRIILVTEVGKEKESVIRLARIGFENVEGFLDGGYRSWTCVGDPVQKYNHVLARQLKDKMSERSCILDVRQSSEWKGGVIKGSQLISLNELEQRIQELPKDRTIYVYCKLGGRSLIAYSILTKNGFQNVYDIKDGFEAAKAAGISIVELDYQLDGSTQ